MSRLLPFSLGGALVLGAGAVVAGSAAVGGTRLPMTLALLGLASACLALAGWVARPRPLRAAVVRGDVSVASEPSTATDPLIEEGELLDVIAAFGQPVALLAVQVVGARLHDARRPLARVAKVVHTWVPTAPLYRLTDDTVAVLVPSAQVGLIAPLVLNRARKALHESLSPRAGVAFFPDDGRDLTSLSNAAASAIGRGGLDIAVANRRSAARAQLRDRMTSELRAAIREREIVPHFQPIADARSMRVAGAEALARWLRGDAGVVEASEFVAGTEGSGAALDLGAQMIAQSCRFVATWRRRVHPDAFVAINLSDTELRDRRTAEVIHDELTKWRLDPSALRVEVPDDTFRRGRSPAMRAIVELRELGTLVWADVVGNTLPDLDRMATVGADGVKVPISLLVGDDGKLIDDVAPWLERVQRLGFYLHVARVERAEQLYQVAVVTPPDFVQGWAIAAPLPPGDMPALLGREVGGSASPARV